MIPSTSLAAPSKRDQLIRWMQAQHVFRTHDVIAFGLSLHWTRAQREKGALRAAGLIRELTDEEKRSRGIDTKEGVYCWVGEPVTEPNGQQVMSFA